MKNLLFLILLLIIVLSPAFSFGYQTHNDQILNSIYGFSNGWNTMKGYDNTTQVKYYLLSDAAYVAIDYNGVSNTNKLDSIDANLKKLGVDSTLINRADYTSIGMGTHRAYNHQGFDYDYFSEGAANAAKKQARWSAGKDLMIKTAKSAYNLNDNQANVLAREIYYVHMLGDLQEGSVKSIKLMGRIGEISGLLDDFELSLKKYAREISVTDPYASRIILQQSKKLSKIKKQYSNYKGVSPETRNAAKKIVDEDLAEWRDDTNRKLGINLTSAKMNKFKIAKSLGGNLGAAAIGTGAYALYRAVTDGGFSNISLSEIAYVGSISAAGAVTDTVIDIGVPQLAKVFRLGTKATGAVFIFANALVDSAFDSYGYMSAYNNGFLTGPQAARNIGISLGKNIFAGGVSLGINAGLTAILPVFIPGGVIWVLSGGLSIGAYHVINNLVEQVIQHFELRDIVISVENGSADYALWVDQYFGT